MVHKRIIIKFELASTIAASAPPSRRLQKLQSAQPASCVRTDAFDMIRVEWGRLSCFVLISLALAAGSHTIYYAGLAAPVAAAGELQPHLALTAADRQLFASVRSLRQADHPPFLRSLCRASTVRCRRPLARLSPPSSVQVDGDGSGVVSAAEFAKAVGGVGTPPAELAALFAALDTDGSGGLSPAEFAAEGPGPAAAAGPAVAVAGGGGGGDGGLERAVCAGYSEKERLWRRKAAGRAGLLGVQQYRAGASYSRAVTGWDSWEPEWVCPTDELVGPGAPQIDTPPS